MRHLKKMLTLISIIFLMWNTGTSQRTFRDNTDSHTTKPPTAYQSDLDKTAPSVQMINKIRPGKQSRTLNQGAILQATNSNQSIEKRTRELVISSVPMASNQAYKEGEDGHFRINTRESHIQEIQQSLSAVGIGNWPSMATNSAGGLFIALNTIDTFYSNFEMVYIYQSVDGGATWSVYAGFYNTSYDALYPDIEVLDDRVVVSYTENNNVIVYWDLFDGTNWGWIDVTTSNDVAMGTGTSLTSDQRYYVSPYLYIAYGDSLHQAIYYTYSTDFGLTWAIPTSISDAATWAAFRPGSAISFTNTSTYGDRIFITWRDADFNGWISAVNPYTPSSHTASILFSSFNDPSGWGVWAPNVTANGDDIFLVTHLWWGETSGENVNDDIAFTFSNDGGGSWGVDYPWYYFLDAADVMEDRPSTNSSSDNIFGFIYYEDNDRVVAVHNGGSGFLGFWNGWTPLMSSIFDYWLSSIVISNGLIRGAWDDGLYENVYYGDMSFDIVPTVTVLSPNGGESWAIGSSQEISWTWGGSILDVMIEYSTDNGSTWSTITSSTTNVGFYQWTIPSPSSSLCLIRVSDATNSSVFDQSNVVFDIYAPNGTVLSGIVSDAFTGEPLKDVMVEVAEVVTYTDSTGFYEVTNIPAADFTADFSGSPRGGIAPLTVQFSDLSADGIFILDASLEGYIDFNTRLIIPEDQTSRFDFAMSPSLATGSMRFVLNWAEEPRDLDSHLNTPEIFGTAYHVYFGDQGSDVSAPYATLDVDDVTGFGPETITIYQFYDGTYKYYIHLYEGDGTPLTSSNAVVQIYSALGLISTVNVPSTGTGLYWYVCEIDGATNAITLINEIVDLEPASISSEITRVTKKSTKPDRSITKMSTISILDWQWNFGDGNISILQNPMHAFNEQGAYTVSLTINTDLGSFTETKIDYINVEVDRDSASSRILSISDIPDDQGSQVLVVWGNSLLEGNSVEPSVISYSLWRLVDSPDMQGQGEGRVSLGKNALQSSKSEQPFEITINDEVWSFIASMPIEGFDRYSYVAPTLGDSTADGIFWSTFMVSAHTIDPNVFFHSYPDSGYSVDNLAPSAPTGLSASVTGDNEVSLMWDDPIDEDFDYFAVYRSQESGFDPAGMEPYAQTTDVEYIDTVITIGENYYYRLSALDENGNESEFSEEVNALITSIDGNESGIPDQYLLAQNYPNPFNPETTINYSIPNSGILRLTVFNLRGEVVALLVDEYQAVGNYRVKWNASEIPSGIYFYRLQAGDFVETKKMVLLK